MLRLVAATSLALFASCSQDGQADIARGNVLASRGRLEEAERAYRAAAAAAPRDPRPRELLGHLLFDRHQGAGARAAYQDALALDRDSVEALIGLARVDAGEGHPGAAMDWLGRVLARSPDNLYALLSRANLALQRRAPTDVEQALADTARAMTVDPRHPAVLSARARTLLAARDPEGALEVAALLERAHPESPLGPYSRAQVAAAQGDAALALNELRAARQKAGSAWRPAEVRADPSLAGISADPGFTLLLQGP